MKEWISLPDRSLRQCADHHTQFFTTVSNKVLDAWYIIRLKSWDGSLASHDGLVVGGGGVSFSLPQHDLMHPNTQIVPCWVLWWEFWLAYYPQSLCWVVLTASFQGSDMVEGREFCKDSRVTLKIFSLWITEKWSIILISEDLLDQLQSEIREVTISAISQHMLS